MTEINHDSYLVTLEERANSAYTFLERHITSTLILLFITALSLRLALTPFGLVLREDAYVYLLKSLEISRGDFVPVLSHPMGWSLFMAPFFCLFKSDSIFRNMTYARIISDVVGSSLIFPLYYIGKKLLNRRSLLLLLVLFTFSSQLIISATTAYTEPLFTLFFLLSIYFVYKSLDHKSYILLAPVFAGLGYYCRTNGIFVLVIILISFYLLKDQIPEFRYRYFFFIITIFFLTCAPYLYQRYTYFGSPVFYGPNSKFFVDSHREVWSNNIPVPSILDYLKTHTIKEWINRFIIHGFLELIFLDLGYKIISALLAFPFLYGMIRYLKSTRLLPVYITFSIWIIGLAPVWDVFDNPRHLYALVPFILLFTVLAIFDMFSSNRFGTLLQSIFVIVFILFSLVGPVKNLCQDKNSYIMDGLKWGRWAAKHVKGKIAIIEGGDLIMMNLPDTSVSGVGQYDLYAQKSHLSTIRPGCFDTLNEGLGWLKKNGVTHLAIDPMDINRRPYLKEIYSKNKIPPYLSEIYSNYDTHSKWRIKIYSINWDKFNKGS